MLIFLAAGFVAGLGLTWGALLLARRFDVMAIPNARSSHIAPVASIGGLGFVIPTLAWLCWFAADAGDAFSLALAGGAAAIALIGLLDDLFNLSAALRLAVHLLTSALAVLAVVDGNLALLALCAIGLAWFVNLYNFMDGIDGIAGSQAVIFCLGALYFGNVAALEPGLWILLASAAGFLCLNWAPARVIMGDTGSGFLGFTIGVVALTLWQSEQLPLASSLILLAVFWVDATYTLCMRFATGQRVTQAHRNHLYQKAARRFGHGRTSAALWAFAAAWLAPLVALHAHFGLGVLWLAVACAPILAACIAFRAGLPDHTHHA